MRVYEIQEEKKLSVLRCNRCGRILLIKNGILQEGVFQAVCTWGYFSKKDGEIHSFDLCEECYDEFVGGFAVPPEKEEESELL